MSCDFLLFCTQGLVDIYFLPLNNGNGYIKVALEVVTLAALEACHTQGAGIVYQQLWQRWDHMWHHDIMYHRNDNHCKHNGEVSLMICDRLSINRACATNVTKLRLIHHQKANILLIRMVLLFFQSDIPVQKLRAFECEQYATWFQSHTVLIMCVNSERVGLSVRYAIEQ